MGRGVPLGRPLSLSQFAKGENFQERRGTGGSDEL